MSSTAKSLLISLLVFIVNGGLSANPTGGSVVSGCAAIQNAPNITTINQTSHTVIINWNSFSINSGETTRFVQNSAQSAALNRVLGGNASQLNGNLTANGKVFLLNQNGIVIGPGGAINTGGGFVATTRDISDAGFLHGRQHFVGSGNGGITNLGVIKAQLGNIILFGSKVENKGQLTARNGSVDLASGNDLLATQKNVDGNTILVRISSKSGTNAKALVSNSGIIRSASADLMAANGNIYAAAINNNGIVRATGVTTGEGGHIWLTSERGSVVNSGTLNASDTSDKGHGGSIILRSPGGLVKQSGTILSKGGLDGAGGDVDISGNVLKFGGKVELTAPQGITGNLLLDPATLNVITGGLGTISGGQNDNVSTTIDPLAVESALSTANVTLSAQTGITVSNALSWTSGNSLTLQTTTAGSTMALNADITAPSGGLNINAAASTDAITATGNISLASFILQNGSWTQNGSTVDAMLNPIPGPLPSFSATRDFELLNQSSFLRVGGDSTTNTNGAYVLYDVYGLQGIGSPSNAYINNTFEVYSAIDAGVTANWTNGFIPIGTASHPYTGFFFGLGKPISNLAISSNVATSGLFGFSNGNLQGVGITNETISNSTSASVGGLVGTNGTGSIFGCITQGTIQTQNGGITGGLVGTNGGSISNSATSEAINVTNGATTGGLVGQNNGSISVTYSVSSLSGTSLLLGGLTGANSNTGNIVASYWLLDSTLPSLQTSGNNTGTIDGFTSGKTLAQLEQHTTFLPSAVAVDMGGFYTFSSGTWYINSPGSNTDPSAQWYQTDGSTIPQLGTPLLLDNQPPGTPPPTLTTITAPGGNTVSIPTGNGSSTSSNSGSNSNPSSGSSSPVSNPGGGGRNRGTGGEGEITGGDTTSTGTPTGTTTSAPINVNETISSSVNAAETTGPINTAEVQSAVANANASIVGNATFDNDPENPFLKRKIQKKKPKH